jgi:hypothetical protein
VAATSKTRHRSLSGQMVAHRAYSNPFLKIGTNTVVAEESELLTKFVSEAADAAVGVFEITVPSAAEVQIMPPEEH